MRPSTKSCVWWLLNLWFTCTRSWNVHDYVLQIHSRHCPLHSLHFRILYSLLCRKNLQCGPMCRNRSRTLRLGVEMSCPFALSQHFGSILTLGLLLPALWHLVHQMHHHVVHHIYPSSASTPRWWSSIHMMPRSSRAKSWQCLRLSQVPSNKRANPRVLRYYDKAWMEPISNKVAKNVTKSSQTFCMTNEITRWHYEPQECDYILEG